MRDEEDVLGADELRFVDVLLEEHFAAAARTAPAPRRMHAAAVQRRSPLWAAAAALFAVAAMLGTWWLRRDAVAPAQDPTPAPRAIKPFEPKDDADLQAFLQQVVAIEVRTRICFGRPDVDVLRPSGVYVHIADPEVVRAMCANWVALGSTVDNAPDVLTATLALTTADGRQLRGNAGYRAGNACYFGSRCWRAPGIDGTTLQRMSEEETVASIAALRSLPATRANLDCTSLASADLQSELPRFRNLTRLVVTLDDTMATVVAAQTRLEELAAVIPPSASNLTTDGWKNLARLPRLHRLTLMGDVAALDPAALQCMTGLTAVDAPGGLDIALPGLDLLAALTHLPRLTELRIALHWDAPNQSPSRATAVGHALVAMPSLRRLALCTDTAPHEVLVQLQDSSVENLHLAGFDLEEATLDALAAAKRLRELDLRGARFTDKGKGLLVTLQQLTRLDVRGAQLTVDQLATLKEWLPKCTVLDSPGMTSLAWPPLSIASSWTEDR